MGQFKAIYLASSGTSPRVVHAQDLAATTIQGAIDEARGRADACGATSIDVYVDDDKVETVGVGADPYRT